MKGKDMGNLSETEGKVSGAEKPVGATGLISPLAKLVKVAWMGDEVMVMDAGEIKTEYEEGGGMIEVLGDTYPVKEVLKASGFKWDADAKDWKKNGDLREAVRFAVEMKRYASEVKFYPACNSKLFLPEYRKALKSAGVEVE